MNSSTTKGVCLHLYKQLEREAAKIPHYNFREFAKRRIRDYFIVNRSVKDANHQKELIQEGEQALAAIRRQVAVSRLFPHKKTVAEEKV